MAIFYKKNCLYICKGYLKKKNFGENKITKSSQLTQNTF